MALPVKAEFVPNLEEFNLLDLAAAIERTESKLRRHSILMYGDSRTGKTRFAGTLAKVPEIKKINVFDGENSSDALINMYREGLLTEEEAKKFRIFKILDMPDRPYFMETMLKVLTDRKVHNLCQEHGRSNCPDCLKNPATKWNSFCNYNQGHDTWNILESGSQLSTSIMAFLMRGKGYAVGIKPEWPEFMAQGRMLADMLTVIQSGVANWLVTTHIMILEKKDIEKKLADASAANMLDKVYPLMGTKAFCINVSKYFGTTIYLEKKMNKHKGGSSSTYNSEVLTGSRIGMEVEKEEALDFSLIFPKLGIYGPASVATAAPDTKKP